MTHYNTNRSIIQVSILIKSSVTTVAAPMWDYKHLIVLHKRSFTYFGYPLSKNGDCSIPAGKAKMTYDMDC